MPKTARRWTGSPLPDAAPAPEPVAEAIRLWWAAWRDKGLKDEVHARLVRDGDPARSAALASYLDASRWERDRWWQLQQVAPPASVAYRYGEVTWGYTAADGSGYSPVAVVGGEVVRR